MDKKMMYFVAIVIIASALSFYAGSQYALKGSTAASNVATESASGAFRQGGARQRGASALGGQVSGTILSQNAQGIVVQLRDGGSKIIFVSPTTEITKFVPGSSVDLEINKNISVTGDANPDGSVNAKIIQLRPDVQFRPNGLNQQATTTQGQ